MNLRVIELVATAVDSIVLAGMWVMLPFGPVAAALIAGDSSYVRRYPRSLLASIEHLKGIKRGRPIGRAVTRWLGAEQRVPQTIVGSCSHCGRCCLDKACIFLRYDAQGQSRCQIYRTAFWSILPCGEYPLNQEEIVQYACPSFSAIKARVIPIRPVPVAAAEQSDEEVSTA